jgi:hypothetical protein
MLNRMNVDFQIFFEFCLGSEDAIAKWPRRSWYQFETLTIFILIITEIIGREFLIFLIVLNAASYRDIRASLFHKLYLIYYYSMKLKASLSSHDFTSCF